MSAISIQPIGQSEAFHTLMDQVSNTAALDNPVLITGERGAGKEMIASRLHFLSARWEAVYIKVNCAAFTEPLLDRELFGETFTDSRGDIKGRFNESDGGSIFLDNIEALTPRLQEKLMRAVEYGEYEAGADADAQPLNIRLVTATRTDLQAAALRGDFRADLLGRLAFDVIAIPPLRARREDIAPLAQHFGRKISAQLGADTFHGFTPEAMALLETQDWPGNIRELKTAVERNVAQAFLNDETLSLPISEINFDPFEGPYRVHETDAASAASYKQMSSRAVALEQGPAAQETTNFNERVFTFERRLIDEALSQSGGHQGKAAAYLDLTYHSFRGFLRKHGLKK